MRFKVLKSYTDKNSHALILAGMVVDVSPTRAEEINSNGAYLVQLDGIKGTPGKDTTVMIPTAPTPTVAKKPAAKKRKTKKG